VTFATWAEQWLSSNPSKRRTTLARDETVLRKHFIPDLGRRALATITPAYVRGAVERMATAVAPDTVRTNVGVLRAVFNAAVEADLISRSPVRGIRLPTRSASVRPTLTEAEIKSLADAIGPRYRALVLVGAVLGLRWSEAVGLRICDIHFLGGTLTVNQTVSEVAGRLTTADTKSRSSQRTMTVPRFLIEELASHLATNRRPAESGDLVFAGPKGGPLRRSFAARIFTPAVARAGLPPEMTFHGLRHVAASLMVEQGEHPRVIQQRLGHATARLSMELYAHVPEPTDRQVAEHLDARFADRTGTERARRPLEGGSDV
jgi:integrase